MKRHSFNQQEVMKYHTESSNKIQWMRFMDIVDTFAYKVRVTGGNFLTHEISCTKEDFDIILGLLEV